MNGATHVPIVSPETSLLHAASRLTTVRMIESEVPDAAQPRQTTVADSAEFTVVLTTLGAPLLARVGAHSDAPVAAESGQAACLAAYLACAPGRCATRDEVAGMLWNVDGQTGPREKLRKLVSRLRDRFGEASFIADSDTIRLGPTVRCDRDEFLQAADVLDHERAVSCYRGDFFSRHSSRIPDFDDWAGRERLRLRATFRRSAQLVVQERLSALRFQEAQLLARRVRDLDPLDQAGWRLLLETQMASRATAFVSATADEFERLLEDEGLTKERDTISTLARARRPIAAEPAADSGIERLPLTSVEPVGRESEFRTLLDAWSAAQRHRSRVVVVTGQPGLGKTRLLQDLQARLRADGQRVLFVKANRGGAVIAYGFISSIARALAKLRGASAISPESAAVLVSLDPTLSAAFPNARPDTASGSEAMRRRVKAIEDLVIAVTEDAPVAVLLDDWHWSDTDSRAILGSVLADVGGRALLTVVASRSTPRAQAAQLEPAHSHLAQSQPEQPRASIESPAGSSGAYDAVLVDGAILLPLSALTIDEATQLVASVAPLPAASWVGEFIAALHDVCGGVPLHLIETLQLALDTGALEWTESGWRAPDVSRLLQLLTDGASLQHRLTRLSADDLHSLQVLAIGGGTLDERTLIAACEVTAEAGQSALLSLERQRMIMHVGDGWTVAHDEYATRAAAMLALPLRQRTHAHLARALLDSGVGASEPAPDCVRAAAAHLRRADDLPAAIALFMRVRHQRRRHRQHVSTTLLAAELYGADYAARVAAHVYELDRVARRRRRTRVAAIAGTLTAVAAAAFVLVRPAARIAPRTLQWSLDILAVDTSSAVQYLYSLPIDSSLAESTEPIDVARMATRTTIPSGTTEEAPRPFADEWAVVRTRADGAGTEIALVSAAGSSSTLTDDRSDNVHPSWSPDGRQLVFATSRWSARGHTELAVLDPATRQIQRMLPAGAEPRTDRTPQWSPDGRHIAFMRTLHNEGSLQLCVTTIDAADVHCDPVRDGGAPLQLGWASDTLLFARVARGSEQQMVEVGVHRDAIPVTRARTPALTISANGEWIACDCPITDGGGDGWVVGRLVSSWRADNARALTLPAGMVFRNALWHEQASSSLRVDSVRIAPSLGNPRVGTDFALRAEAWRGRDGWRPATHIRWRTLDSAIATVDSTGRLTAYRAGRVTILASLAGWRETRVSLTIVENATPVLLDESWRAGIGAAWTPFGEPRPQTVSTSSGMAFTNGGDGRFVSGAYSAVALDVSAGLAVDFQLSAPITDTQWQTQDVALIFGLRDRELSLWDHRGGYVWGESRGWGDGCGLAVPADAEGAHFGETMRAGLGAQSAAVAMRDAWRAGGWFTVRLQLFPDGRCGVAVNGEPVGMGRVSAGRAARLVLWGNSVGTTMAVGPVRVRQGVVTDIDWRRASR